MTQKRLCVQSESGSWPVDLTPDIGKPLAKLAGALVPEGHRQQF
jgi:hypothetical protein